MGIRYSYVLPIHVKQGNYSHPWTNNRGIFRGYRLHESETDGCDGPRSLSLYLIEHLIRGER